MLGTHKPQTADSCGIKMLLHILKVAGTTICPEVITIDKIFCFPCIYYTFRTIIVHLSLLKTHIIDTNPQVQRFSSLYPVVTRLFFITDRNMTLSK